MTRRRFCCGSLWRWLPNAATFGVIALIYACDAHDPTPAVEPDAGAVGGNVEPPGPFDGLVNGGLCSGGTGDVTLCQAGCLELCNGRDDDCDGIVDEGTASQFCVAAYADAVCNEGECQIVRCLGGRRDCDQSFANGCEVMADDPNHCEACGVACEMDHASTVCVASSCRVLRCEEGYADCDHDGVSCEARLDSAEHCGACGAQCGKLENAEGRCADGRCVPAVCDPGFGDCDGDPTNGCEAQLDDLQHCGACGQTCDLAGCKGGVCSAADCNDKPGFADCDGDQTSCEVDLQNDPGHCGSCNNTCVYTAAEPHALSACVQGRCTIACEPGWGECDGTYANGCESRLDDANNCGQCGNKCEFANAVQSCVAGACLLDSCLPDFADCDGDPSNGCEQDTREPSRGGHGPCLPDARCERDSLAGSDYFFCPTPRNWRSARVMCQSQQFGDLAHVPDETTRDFFRRRLRTRSWIGHTDEQHEGLWVWSYNQMPFYRSGQFGGGPVNGMYSDWSPGEPNASGNCGAIYETGLLDDLSCTREQPFVCERYKDLCPDDPNKFDPGQCGCGVKDTDSDRDGYADCVE